MAGSPRAAVGGCDDSTDYRPVLWGLMDRFDRCGVQVQNFFSQASFVPWDAALTISGRGYRHLDSWLMSPTLCREVFHHGLRGAEFALVEGCFDGHAGPSDAAADASSLDTLCQWLGLPRCVVVDASRIDGCNLPRRPQRVDAVLIDGAADRGELARLAQRFELLWGAPVVGGRHGGAHLPALIDRLPPGVRPARELCKALGDGLELFGGIDRFIARAAGAGPVAPEASVFHSASLQMAGVKVAVAYDEAFHCYFPDVLDLLETAGAELRDFSPLRDESLPPATDVVVLGCGHPERQADALAGNHCMTSALRRHAEAGGRVYAEGGGLAYIAREMALPDGRRAPMVGLLPIVAQYNEQAAAPSPESLHLAGDSWLGAAGSKLRGYLNHRWRLQPAGPLVQLAQEPRHRTHLVGGRHVVGSLLHLNLLAQAHLLQSFLARAESSFV